MEVMTRIREGMRVLDAKGDEVGTVESLKMGSAEAATAQGQTADGDDGLFEDLVAGLAGDGDDLPDQQRDRMLRLGYIKVDRKGLFKDDVYVVSEDIRRVGDDVVYITFTPE
jgi:hypothetical protein